MSIFQFLSIDEFGFLWENDQKIKDLTRAQSVLKNIQVNDSASTFSIVHENKYLIEAFDAPYIAIDIYNEHNVWKIETPYELQFSFQLETLKLDEWDRFHGITDSKVRFVLTPAAQNKFFELLDEFDDDSITYHAQNYEIPNYWQNNKNLENSQYWCDVYNSSSKPGWDLGAPANALKDMLPRLKLPKSRVLVLGCGEGHDAAFFAESGHVVTAIDFSAQAIARAKKNYGDYSQLTFFEMDIFKLPSDWIGQFDIVFEHTCYCAINPNKRNELAKVWRTLLQPQGFLMGVFFTMDKINGPPYGATEWEIRERLKKYFQFTFWGRWHDSIPGRQGKELFLYSQKK